MPADRSLKGRSGCDVLFWADLHPNKRGSFEDYVCQLAAACRQRGLKIHFVLGDAITEEVESRFAQYGVAHERLSNRAIKSLGELRRMCRLWKPRIVHFNFISPCSRLLWIRALRRNLTVLFTDHFSRCGIDPGAESFLWLKTLRRRLYARCVDRYLCVSEFVGACIQREFQIPPEKIRIIYNGVDVARFSPIDSAERRRELKRKFLGADGDPYVVSFVGQLIDEKGFLIFLDAAQEILRTRRDVVFLVAGDGCHRDRCFLPQAAIRYLGKRDDVEELMAISDIIACPSTWNEAFGLVLAEAAACSVCAVATAVGGISEVVCDRETGLLIEPGSVEQLAAAIDELLSDDAARIRLGARGRERAVRLFSLESMVAGTIDEYSRWLAAPPATVSGGAA